VLHRPTPARRHQGNHWWQFIAEQLSNITAGNDLEVDRQSDQDHRDDNPDAKMASLGNGEKRGGDRQDEADGRVLRCVVHADTERGDQQDRALAAAGGRARSNQIRGRRCTPARDLADRRPSLRTQPLRRPSRPRRRAARRLVLVTATALPSERPRPSLSPFTHFGRVWTGDR
jgi:hypothetical protein